MIYGYKATQAPKNRQRLDIRDSVDRLYIDLRAETDDERKVLARVRQQLSDAARKGENVLRIEFDIPLAGETE